jgi:hypothetical protein
VDDVRDWTDVAAVVQAMLANLDANPHTWENDTLERFLEAFAALIGSADQLMVNRDEQPPVTPTWALFTELLVGASGYE